LYVSQHRRPPNSRARQSAQYVTRVVVPGASGSSTRNTDQPSSKVSAVIPHSVQASTTRFSRRTRRGTTGLLAKQLKETQRRVRGVGSWSSRSPCSRAQRLAPVRLLTSSFR